MQRGAASIKPRARGRGLEGLESYENPRVRRERLETITAVAQAAQGAVTAAAGLMLPAAESDQSCRNVMVYDDL